MSGSSAGGGSFRLVRGLVRWVKLVEPTRITMREPRGPILEDTGRNPLLVEADHTLIDTFTDSGTSSMSSEQSNRRSGDHSDTASWVFLNPIFRTPLLLRIRKPTVCPDAPDPAAGGRWRLIYAAPGALAQRSGLRS